MEIFVKELTLKSKSRRVSPKLTDVFANPIKTQEDAVQALRQVWPNDLDVRETGVALYLNHANKILGYQIVSTGGTTGTIFCPQIIFSAALLLAGCTGVIIAHNHPSGQTKASEADLRVTRQFKEAAALLNFHLMDSIILTETAFLSII